MLHQSMIYFLQYQVKVHVRKFVKKATATGWITCYLCTYDCYFLFKVCSECVVYLFCTFLLKPQLVMHCCLFIYLVFVSLKIKFSDVGSLGSNPYTVVNIFQLTIHSCKHSRLGETDNPQTFGQCVWRAQPETHWSDHNVLFHLSLFSLWNTGFRVLWGQRHLHNIWEKKGFVSHLCDAIIFETFFTEINLT